MIRPTSVDFRTKYINAKDLNKKKEIISAYLSARQTLDQDTFLVIKPRIDEEPHVNISKYTFIILPCQDQRIELFEYFLIQCKTLHGENFKKNILNISFVSRLINSTESLEITGLIVKEFRKMNPLAFSDLHSCITKKLTNNRNWNDYCYFEKLSKSISNVNYLDKNKNKANKACAIKSIEAISHMLPISKWNWPIELFMVNVMRIIDNY